MKKSLLAKGAGIALMGAMLVTAAVPARAQTPTTEGLLALIAQLQAQIASLTSSTSSQTVGAGRTFTTDLTVGSSGAEVTALQQFLVSKGFLRMPAGVAMGYFGEVTRAALAAFQAANGITPSVGFFGPATRAKVNSMSVVVVTPGTPGTPSTPGSLQGGAGDIDVTQRSSGLQDEILEGQRNAKVLGFEVEADGSDISLSSIRVELRQEGTGSKRLDRYADEVLVMRDDRVIGTARVRDFSETRNVYSRNISVSGSNTIVREGDRAKFYVAISAANNVDTRDIGQDWKVGLGQIRFNDATGAILTDGTGTGINGSISNTFAFEDLTSSGDVKLTAREGNRTINEARTVQVSDTSDTRNVGILNFTLEAKGSDIYLNEIPFDITSSGAGVTEIANDFRLMMDGEEVGTVKIDTTGAGGNTTGNFASSSDTTRRITIVDLDNDDVVINEGDVVTFTLVADINDIDGAFANGNSLSVSLDANDIGAEDQNGDNLETTTLSGTVASDEIRFAARGVVIEEGDADTSAVFTNLNNTSSDDSGKFVINFTVKAFDQTAFIALTAASSTDSNPANAGAYVTVEDSNTGVPVSGGVAQTTLERVSGGTLTGNYVRINPGQSAKLRVTVYYDPDAAGVYRAQLHAVNFAQSAVAGTQQQLAVPEYNYQSPSELIQN